MTKKTWTYNQLVEEFNQRLLEYVAQNKNLLKANAELTKELEEKEHRVHQLTKGLEAYGNAGTYEDGRYWWLISDKGAIARKYLKGDEPE